MPHFKATRPDGTDFRTGTVHYDVGSTIRHPNPHHDDASGYLSVSTTPADCTGMDWPCRLFEVEPVGETWSPEPVDLPNKVACHAVRVVRELDATDALGPQGAHVAALIERADALTAAEAERLGAAWGAARDAARDAVWCAAWGAARDAAWDAARDAVWCAAWGAARDAAWGAAWGAARDAAWGASRALVVRDLISTEHYDALTKPWRTAVGPIHPDDKD